MIAVQSLGLVMALLTVKIRLMAVILPAMTVTVVIVELTVAILEIPMGAQIQMPVTTIQMQLWMMVVVQS